MKKVLHNHLGGRGNGSCPACIESDHDEEIKKLKDLYKNMMGRHAVLEAEKELERNNKP